MTVSLRESMAKTLYNAYEHGSGDWDELCERYPALQETWLRVADAAIAELLVLAEAVAETMRK